MDAYMQAAVRHEQFAGSILVARDGQPLISRGYGMANYELQVPNRPETVFRIASLTKQFTAMAIMQLQEKGRLRISDSICKYLDDCPSAWQPITLRHLLTHGSGIQNVSSLPDWDEDLGLKRYRRSEFVRLFRDLPLDFAPGEKFKYSNSGYFLLGLVIERASGKSYGDYLREQIFAPLGMTHSLFDDNRRLIPGRATGYYSRGTEFVSPPFIDPTTTFAAGGITSTTGDLLLWDQALYTDKLVSRRALDEMFTANQGDYGYGWRVGEAFGHRKFDHSGSLNGFSAYILRFPDDRVTVIVLSNSDRASAGKTGTNLAAIVFGAPYTLPKQQLRDRLWDAIVQQGTEAAIGQYRELRRTQPDAHDFGEGTLLELGYDLADGGKLAEAVAIFELNLEMYPKSAYSYDGLADVAIERGEEDKAIAWFEKSLSLDPTNTYATEGLERLRRDSN
jgi:CubicO group peptidase (beta-lactamase class C family)